LNTILSFLVSLGALVNLSLTHPAVAIIET
jgi:hypothetical protein